MTVPFAYIVTPEAIVFTEPSGKTQTVNRSVGVFTDCLALVKQINSLRASEPPQDGQDSEAVTLLVERLVALVEPAKAIAAGGHGRVEVKNGQVLFDGSVLHNAITERILWCVREGMPFLAYVRFLDLLMDNPSHRAVSELFGFIERNRMGISDDGHILAYKRVRDDFADVYTGTFNNSPGQTPKMPRNQVSDDPSIACSAGLHVCSQSYLPSYGAGHGNRIVIVKVNPMNVVSVPLDHAFAKMRCCEYLVLGEYTGSDRDDLLSQTPVWTDDRLHRGTEGGGDIAPMKSPVCDPDDEQLEAGDYVECIDDDNTYPPLRGGATYRVKSVTDRGRVLLDGLLGDGYFARRFTLSTTWEVEDSQERDAAEEEQPSVKEPDGHDPCVDTGSPTSVEPMFVIGDWVICTNAICTDLELGKSYLVTGIEVRGNATLLMLGENTSMQFVSSRFKLDDDNA